VERLEGLPRLGREDLMERLELTPHAAWRQFRKLRREGVVSSVTMIDAARYLGPCECRAFIRFDWRQMALNDAFEASLRADRNIVSATRVTGQWDYIVRAFHPAERAANAWFRGLLERPGVRHGQLKYCKTILERRSAAAAILASDGDHN
jgi:DNA-binding Lrp family transcriptional regulator